MAYRQPRCVSKRLCSCRYQTSALLKPPFQLEDDVPDLLVEAYEKERRQLWGFIFGPNIDVGGARTRRGRHGVERALAMARRCREPTNLELMPPRL
jgi:hypothetical protein